ncbi:MAG: hypothetical protein RI898_1376 [Actinomycetota bacterium]
MTNAELFDSWKGLDDHELSIELARVTGLLSTVKNWWNVEQQCGISKTLATCLPITF